ncbi:hypothetical protein Glove_564g45 [Diversispora epigaea]|uniref:Uncharacterized protein n=1 Tax=Diversispora epigaea TaxID=1348612 RepID=A0A397GAB0_9GLOM|nr:hypothetical protein Glove_564g45 [Diversispora epigaea]
MAFQNHIHQILDDLFAPLICTIEFEVDSIDELVLILKESEQTDMLRRIGHCRKKVLGLVRLLGTQISIEMTYQINDILSRLTALGTILIS